MNQTIATPKQVKWLEALLRTKDTSAFPANWVAACERVTRLFELCVVDGFEVDNLNEYIAQIGGDPLTREDFDKFLGKLRPAPYKPTTKPALAEAKPVTEDGMYNNDGTFFKVKRNQAGTRLYAERLVVHEGVVKGGHVKVSFRYQPGAIHKLNADMKMTYKQAKAFGALCGTCVQCGRLLTNELSIALGIGPICGSRAFGGEWPRLMEAAKLSIGQ